MKTRLNKNIVKVFLLMLTLVFAVILLQSVNTVTTYAANTKENEVVIEVSSDGLVNVWSENPASVRGAITDDKTTEGEQLSTIHLQQSDALVTRSRTKTDPKYDSNPEEDHVYIPQPSGVDDLPEEVVVVPVKENNNNYKSKTSTVVSYVK